MSRKILLCAVLFVASAVAVGCGGDSGTGPKPGEQPTPKQSSKEKLKYGAGDSAVPKGKE